MNTLEHLKAVDELDNLANIYDWHKDRCAGHAHDPICPVIKLRRQIIADIEHTQTIQSVRERVEGMRKEPRGAYKIVVHTDESRGYNEALDDLLKDLEAPVEGDGV